MRFVFVVFRLAYERAKAAPAVRGRNRVIGGLFTGGVIKIPRPYLALTDLHGVTRKEERRFITMTLCSPLSH